MNVLLVFANPRGTSALRLGEEDRTIRECIRRSKNRDNLRLVVLHAATIDDVRRALLDEEHDVVHFSGHGTGTGLAFEDINGNLYVPPQDALAGLLAEFSPPIRCLLLNACYSVSQGRFTSLGVPYTIAMEGPISDDAAIMFAEGFYDSIGAGKDVEFSFRQGIHTLRLRAHTDSAVPHLLKKGEFADISQPSSSAEREIQRRSPDEAVPPPVLLGLALDVSGSMEQSMGTSLGRQTSRLRGFVDAFENSVGRTREALKSMRQGGTSMSLFAYAFGMRSGDVCDLLSLIKAADGLVSAEELERLKAKHTKDIERRYSRGSSSFGGLESLARSFGFGDVVESVREGIRADAEAEVRKRVIAELLPRLADRLASIGDTTIDLDQMADIWRGTSSTWDDAKHFIFGDTPMCAALRKALDRFNSELERQGKRCMPVLLLVSDGEPTDGDPTSIGRQLREQGITVICCYITDRDVVANRTLVNAADPDWPKGARVMFDLASEIADDSPLTQSLLRSGWTVGRRPRAFLQANQSEMLEDLVGMAMSPVESGTVLLPKGR
jgi:hypothetical protein